MDFEFPQLISTEDNCPIIIVAEQKDLLESKLLTNRQVCSKVTEVQKHDKLVPVEDFLKQLTQKSPLAYVPQPESQQLLKDLSKQKQQFDERVNATAQSFKDLGTKMSKGHLSICEQIVSKLTTSLKESSNTIKQAEVSLSQVLKSDPEQDASIPKPKEIVEKINQLKAAPELPEYLFTTTKRLRAWQQAPEELCVWNNTKEKFYRQHLQQSLNQEFKQKSEIALKFWNHQIAKLGEQMLNIIQEDQTLNQQRYVDLNINDANSLALLLNTMITPETRIILNLTNFSLEDSKSIATSLQSLDSIVNLSINWKVNGKTSGLANIAQAIVKMEQLRLLQFQFDKVSVQHAQAKDFFSEFKDINFPNLVEVTVNSTQSEINDSIPHHLAKALKAIGSSNVQKLIYQFAQNSLDEKSAEALGDSLEHYTGLKKLVLNFSGYSLFSNSIKDKGFEGLVQHITKSGNSLIDFNLNVSRNGLTDKSAQVLNKLFQQVKWNNLKNVSFGWNYNNLTENGARKLGKLLHSLPVLVEAQINVNSTQINHAGIQFIINALGSQVNTQVSAKQAAVKHDELTDFEGKVSV